MAARSTRTGRTRAFTAQYGRLLAYVRPYWRRLAAAGLLLAANSLLGLALPWIVQNVVDRALARADMQLLNEIVAGLMLLFGVRSILAFGESYLLSWVGERVVTDMRKQLYAHMQVMPLRFFSSARLGDLISRLSSDVVTIQEAATTTLLSLLSQTITFVGGLAIIVFMDWRLTLLMLATVPLAMIGILLIGRTIRRISRQVQDALGEVTALAEEALGGVRIIKSFAREPYEISRYSSAVEQLFGVALRRVRVRAGLGPIISLLAYGSIAVVLWFGGREVVQGRLTQGQLVSFLIYTIMVASPIAAFTALYGQFQQALGASERIFELLSRPSEVEDDPAAPPLPPIQGSVELESVSFDYGDSDQAHAVLQDISLRVEPGQVVALVGPSGAGKTTLVNLIPRFYEPVEGRVLVDGHDIRRVRLRSLREQIGIVPQETALFSGSIRANIAYGKLDASEAEIWAAAEAANADRFIKDFPEQYETLVGERGVKLSGGQRQRIAIARAVLKDPRILILDEATSSLDSESEQAVQEALARLMRGRTTFVIAHRLSTVTNADWIIVLDDGRLVEQGTHETLLSQAGGLYRRLHALQFGRDEKASPGVTQVDCGAMERVDTLDDGPSPRVRRLGLPYLGGMIE